MKNDLPKKASNLPIIIFQGRAAKLLGEYPMQGTGDVAGKMFKCRNNNISYSFKKDDGTDHFALI